MANTCKFSTYYKCSAFAKRPIKDMYYKLIFSGFLSPFTSRPYTVGLLSLNCLIKNEIVNISSICHSKITTGRNSSIAAEIWF